MVRIRSIACKGLVLSFGAMIIFAQPASASDSEEPSSSFPTSDLQWYQSSFWRTVDGKPVNESWQFTEHEINLIHPRGGSGSLISPPLPASFELSFQWKIEAGGNNGLKYRVRWFEDRWLGIEYQMIDEPIPLPEARIGSTASIYDLVAPIVEKPIFPAGQWNSAKIVAFGHQIDHYLNDVLVASADTLSMEWQCAVAKSKFFGYDDFGQPRTGDSIMLTDHGGLAAYRNFRLKALPTPERPKQTAVRAPQLANAFRNGWADQNSIVLWTRTTVAPEMLVGGHEFVSVSNEEAKLLSQSRDPEMLNQVQLPDGVSLNQINGACPGAEGEVRLTYFPEDLRTLTQSTDWSRTGAKQDFTHQWKLEGLQPGTRYVAIVEARPLGSDQTTAVKRGGFQTAPPAQTQAPLTFCMTTCHDFIRRDDGDWGHKIYSSMNHLQPDFVVHAGDVEYYDKPLPWAWTVELMRFKWARIFSLPSNRNFYAKHTTYWVKDDHDTLKNDCWSGQHYGAVSFEEGVRIFNQEQFPAIQTRYRTVEWGRNFQFWILEGRDFRSPNTMPDGPDKTILGNEQKEWLKRTLKESEATFKLVFSPTPIVGPDRDSKHDNHANEDFHFEGRELRDLFGSIDGLLVLCGDRHWQYASLDQNLNLWEFGCGPGSENHELGWKQDDIRLEHRFLRVQGGFLSGSLSYDTLDSQPVLAIRHHDVLGKPVSQFQFPAGTSSHSDSSKVDDSESTISPPPVIVP